MWLEVRGFAQLHGLRSLEWKNFGQYVAPGPRVNMAAENVKVWHLCEVN